MWRYIAIAAFTVSTCDLSAQFQQQQQGQQFGGVAIDADGFLTLKPVSVRAVAAAVRRQSSQLAGELAEPTGLRFVSLKRLLAPDADRTRETMAGLTKVVYVVADPQAGDIYLAGPAEPFGEDPTGRVLGAETGRPVITLTMLVEAFRHANETVGCSIDPEPERQKALNEYIRRNSTPASPSQIAARYKTMARVLGRQNVSVFGVPADSMTALITVEADYLMKQIALGSVPSRVRGVASQLAHTRLNGNSLQRWWFAPQYDGIFTDEERLAFELTGPRLKLLAQDEISDASGVRFDAAITSETTQAFAKSFSAKMDDLARVHPAIASLQNVTDLVMAASLIRSERLDERSGFDPLAAARLVELPEKTWPEPKTVPSSANTKRSGKFVLGLIGGVVMNGPRMQQQFAPTARPEGAGVALPSDTSDAFWINGE